MSAFLLVTVFAVVEGNMPASALTIALDSFAGPVRDITGLGQDWVMYSQPRIVSAYVEARVEDADGSVHLVDIPDRRGLGAYVDYRWQKYEEVLRPDDGRAFWPVFAQYVAERARAEGWSAVRITLIRRWAQSRPPGLGPERDPWLESTMATFSVAEPSS